MKTTLFAAIMDGTASDAMKPDYSGNWKVNLEKSKFGAMGAPISYTIKIAHCGDWLHMELRHSGAFDYYSNVAYRIDGATVSYQVNGMAMKGNATWDGDTIITQSVSEMGSTIRNRMTLSRDGWTLTCRVATPGGEMVYVFNKQ